MADGGGMASDASHKSLDCIPLVDAHETLQTVVIYEAVCE